MTVVTAPVAAAAAAPLVGASSKPPGPLSASSGDSEAVRRLTSSSMPNWSATQPAGSPTASTTVFSKPSSIFSPELRID